MIIPIYEARTLQNECRTCVRHQHLQDTYRHILDMSKSCLILENHQIICRHY